MIEYENIRIEWFIYNSPNLLSDVCSFSYVASSCSSRTLVAVVRKEVVTPMILDADFYLIYLCCIKL